MKHYRLRIINIFPESAKQIFRQEDSCYLGISIGSTLLYAHKLQAALDKISQYSSNYGILINDYLNRLTAQIHHGCSEEQAIQVGAQQSADFLKVNQAYILNPGMPVIRCSEIYALPEYQSYYQQFLEIHRNNTRFAALVDESAMQFVQRQAQHNKLGVDFAHACALSERYILEELAIYTCLSQQGRRVEWYPGGELPVLQQIQAGLYPEVPEPLKRKITVCFKLIKRKQP